MRMAFVSQASFSSQHKIDQAGSTQVHKEGENSEVFQRSTSGFAKRESGGAAAKGSQTAQAFTVDGQVGKRMHSTYDPADKEKTSTEDSKTADATETDKSGQKNIIMMLLGGGALLGMMKLFSGSQQTAKPSPSLGATGQSQTGKASGISSSDQVVASKGGFKKKKTDEEILAEKKAMKKLLKQQEDELVAKNMAQPVYGTVSADVSSVPTNQKGKKKNVMIHMQRLDAPNYDQPVDPVLQHNQSKGINSSKKA